VAKTASGKRYAEALFSLAQEQGKAEQWLEALGRVREVLSDPTAVLYFSEPRMLADRKLDAINQISGDVDKLLANFLGLLVERSGTALLPKVIDAFGELLNESIGRVQATVTSATTVTSEQEQRLKDSLSKMLDKDVVLDVNEDPEIIGGVVVRVGDQIIDGSVKTKLQALKQRLERESLT
jgi:F-type H+-transporting ATPase subunit delta